MRRSSGSKRRRHRCRLSNRIAVDVTTIIYPVSGCCHIMGRSKLQERYYDPKRAGSYGGVAALRRAVPEQNVE